MILYEYRVSEREYLIEYIVYIVSYIQIDIDI